MTVLAWGGRHGTIMQQSEAADGGFGKDTTWIALGAVRMRMTTPSSRISRMYSRDGFENVVTVQCENSFPKRISGFETLRDLLLAADQTRMRINYRGRTMSIMGVRYPNDGWITGNDTIVNIDCIEAPQPQGILDVA